MSTTAPTRRLTSWIPWLITKRKRPKHRRSGCLLCKPHKLTANAKSERRHQERGWIRHEERGW